MRHIKTSLLLLMLCLYGLPQFALASEKKVTIYGNAKEYRGVELVFTYEKDFLSKEHKQVARFEPDVEGNFKVELSLEKTRRLEVELGRFLGILYAEPGMSYEIVLPPRVDKNKGQKYNPFFVAEEVFLGVINHKGRDLTSMIANAEDSLAVRIMPGMRQLTRTANRIATEKLFAKLNSFFADYPNPYFKQYLAYRLHALRYVIYLRDDQKMLKSRFMNKPLALNVPTYTKLFRELAKDGLMRSADTKQWSAYNIIKMKKGIETLRDSLERFSFAQDKKLLDLYIACGLHDAFYCGDFPKKECIAMMHDLKQKATTNDIATIAANLSQKTAHLMEGSAAPDIQLVDANGKTVRLSDFRGRFVYLVFGASWSVPFKKEMKLLKKLYNNKPKELELVTVSFDQDFQRMLYLAQKHDYRWPMLHFNFDESIAQTYRVQVNPTYYLIGPDGTLLQSPAIAISENFVEFFVDIHRNWQRKKALQSKGVKQ